MSDKQQINLIKWTDILFKAAVIVGPVIMACLVLYLKDIFVSRAEFEKMQPRVELIERTLLLMANQERQLADHEDRIRFLEQQRDGRQTK